MTTKPLVIYHADCTDGYGAAFAAWMKLGDEAEYVPMQYGGKNYEFPSLDREVYILDFSFPRSTMEFLFDTAKRVVWLDHHKTAFEMWCGKYEKGMNYHSYPEDKNFIILDDNASGAMISWIYFHPGTEVPLLIRHIDDRDRWQFKMEGSKELHAALSSYKPWSFEQWGAFCMYHDPDFGRDPKGLRRVDVGVNKLKQEGAAILRAQDQHVKSMVKQARKCRIISAEPVIGGEHWQANILVDAIGLAVNASLHQSEVGHELANTSGTYGLVWYLGDDGRARCSLRSNGDYDVASIARALGGGGHYNAAGFETDITTLMGWMK